MSASREKKMRQNTTAGKAAASASAAKKTLKTVIAVVLVIVILASTVFFSMLNNGALNSKLTAVSVDGYKLSPSMINYFYTTERSKLANEMGSLYNMMIDPDRPFDEQEYINDTFDSWGDYMLNRSVNAAAEYCAVYNHAMENGFTLSEDLVANIDSEIENADLFAAYYGLPNGNSFLTYSYGPGCNTENYREYLTLRTVGDQYMAQKIEELTYTQEEIDAKYAEDPSVYDSVTFQLFNISTDMMEESEDALEACKDAAAEMADSITDAKSFNELCKEYVAEDDYKLYDNGAITLFREKKYEDISTASYCDWVFDEERQPGDVTYIAYETDDTAGYHVVHFIEKTDLNYNVVNFHQILVENTAEEGVDAKAEADAIYDEFMNGEEQTEEAFLALVNTHASTSTYTGTFNNTAHGAVQNDYDNWLFDAERKAGDVAVVESEQGYHVMYFAGTGDTYYNYAISEDLKEAAFNEWMAGIVEGVEKTTHAFPMSLVKVF